MKKEDYTIKIWYARNPGEHPIYATAQNNRYQEPATEFSGQTERAVLLKIAKWMIEK